MIGWVEFMEWRWIFEAMGGRMDDPWSGLEWRLQSTGKTMVEAWRSLFGWIHGVELVFVSKRGCSSTIRPSSLPLKVFVRLGGSIDNVSGTRKSIL